MGPPHLAPSPALRRLMDLWARINAHTVVCYLRVRARVSEHNSACSGEGGRGGAPSCAPKPPLHITVKIVDETWVRVGWTVEALT